MVGPSWQRPFAARFEHKERRTAIASRWAKEGSSLVRKHELILLANRIRTAGPVHGSHGCSRMARRHSRCICAIPVIRVHPCTGPAHSEAPDNVRSGSPTASTRSCTPRETGLTLSRWIWYHSQAWRQSPPRTGGMAERSKAVVLKTTVGASSPGVRIPLPPPATVAKHSRGGAGVRLIGSAC